MSDQVKMIVEPDGNVRVTVTGNTSPAVSMTVSAVVDWRTFCRETLPIFHSFTAQHRDGITDLLPPQEG